MAMTHEYDDRQDEMVKRLRRIETRVMSMCRYLGFDPSRGRDRVVVVSVEPLVLDVTGLDVSLGDLLDECRRSGITGLALLVCKGRQLGTFQLGAQHAGNITANGEAAVSEPAAPVPAA